MVVVILEQVVLACMGCPGCMGCLGCMGVGCTVVGCMVEEGCILEIKSELLILIIVTIC
jgi:hypothetical protein